MANSFEFEVVGGGTAVLTSDELDAVLGGRGGPVARRWSFDWRDTAYNLLEPIRGAVLPGGSLKMDVDADVPMTGSVVVNSSRVPFDINSTNIHIAVILELLVQGVYIRMPQALMKVEAGNETILETGDGTAELGMSDLSSYLLGKTTQPYQIAAESNVVDAIETVLDALGLQHDIDPSTDNTPAIISTGPGTTWKTILDRLTDCANMHPVTPDGRGVFSTHRRFIPETISDQVYQVAEPTLLFPPLVRRPEHTARFFNRAIVLFDHPDRAPGYVEVVNASPDSSISIPVLNETVTQKLRNGGYVIDTTRAEEYATYALRHENAKASAAEIKTVFDPRQSIRSQYTLDIPGIEDGTKWEVLGWNIPLQNNGQMTHLIGRAEEVEVTRIV